MNKSLELLHEGFESSSGKTDEFKEFINVFREDWNAELSSVEAKSVSFQVGHFMLSGFFEHEGQTYYWSMNDVRWPMPGTEFLLRTAEHKMDFSGGHNHFPQMKKGMLQQYFSE